MDYGATEVCIQGGLLDDMYLEDYAAMLKAIKSKYEIDIHAFSPMEVYHMSKTSGVTVAHSLKVLKDAGICSMPGTAAEILDDGVRAVICPDKLKTKEWIDVVSTAHRTGIPTTATMMYGHIETWEQRIDHLFIIRDIQRETHGITEFVRIDHLFILRDIQRETHGITEFVPLTFMGKNNPLGESLIKAGKQAGASGMDDLKMYAISRIIFGKDLKNIQASWVKLGIKLAQVALSCGANDIGGTLMEEKISKSAGSKSGECLDEKELQDIIKQAGRNPRRRNTLYKFINSLRMYKYVHFFPVT